MATKPPIFHPYTTNTGQVLLSDLVVYPKASVVFTVDTGGGGVPTAPFQLTTEEVGEGLVLLVYPEMSIIVGYDDTNLPILPVSATVQQDTIVLAAEQYHLLQWPSQYFTPKPLESIASDAMILVNILHSQNSAGDAYNLENR